MRILEMVEQIDQQAEAAGGYELITPPAWTKATTPDADLHWRAAPHPVSGALFQDPDFTYPTAAGPLAFRLFYDSGNAALDSEYGTGPRASWPLRLTSDGTTVTVMHGSGLKAGRCCFPAAPRRNSQARTGNAGSSTDRPRPPRSRQAPAPPARSTPAPAHAGRGEANASPPPEAPEVGMPQRSNPRPTAPDPPCSFPLLPQIIPSGAP